MRAVEVDVGLQDEVSNVLDNDFECFSPMKILCKEKNASRPLSIATLRNNLLSLDLVLFAQ